MSYDNYTFEVIAGDFNSILSRDEIIVGAFFDYPNLLGIDRVVFGIVNRKNIIEYIVDLNNWKHCHEQLKKLATDDYGLVEKIIDRFVEHGEEMNKWTQENVFAVDLKVLSNEELSELLKNYIKLQRVEYALGVAMVILDFQGFSFVENNLEKILKSKVSADLYSEYYRVFTQPTLNSFAQDQEEDLLRLMSKYYSDSQWLDSVKNKAWPELSASYPDFASDLKEHTKKYCWVYYVYTGPAFTEQNFVDFIKDYLVREIDPDQKLAELKKAKEDNLYAKEKYLKDLNPTDFERAILELAGKMIWAKPRRKDYQSKTYFHLEKLYREIGRRFFLSLDQVRSCTIAMLEDGLKSGEIDADLANKLQELHVCVANDNGQVDILYGEEAEKFSKKIIRHNLDLSSENIKEIKGTCACAGKAKGVVRIINRIADMEKMQYGDILVSMATTPSIVSAMKKAAAIITDEGGLTCHASIVSRELNIPCVIGTKFATQALIDGEMVEVDASNGLIKRIS